VPSPGPHPLPSQIADAYLARLGAAERPDPTLESLRALHLAHLRRVPFENLDIHLGRPITLDVDRFVDKIVGQGRGGFCYELNGAFASLLVTLGYGVELLEARVHGPDGVGIRFDHLALRVAVPGDVPGESTVVVADVGFGDSFDEPIGWVIDDDLVDPNGTFRLTNADEHAIDLVRGDEPSYRLYPRALGLDDFAPGCDFHQSPASHFSKNTVISRRTDDGRVTVRGLTLIRTFGGERVESAIEPGDLGQVLVDEFGVRLDDVSVARLAASVG
jgi:N-hydroxyarylamine O-acetyltransferase